MVRGLLLLSLWIFAGDVLADSFYKWVDANGVTHYSESPPAEGGARALDIELTPATEEASAGAASKKVIIYSAEWCGVCKQAKQYFHLHKVTYTEYDVEKSAKGMVDYRKLRGHGVPIILVGNERMDGFEPTRFEQMMRSR